MVEVEDGSGSEGHLKVALCLNRTMSAGTTWVSRNGGSLLTAFIVSRVTGGTTNAGLSTGASSVEVYHCNHCKKQVKTCRGKNELSKTLD